MWCPQSHSSLLPWGPQEGPRAAGNRGICLEQYHLHRKQEMGVSWILLSTWEKAISKIKKEPQISKVKTFTEPGLYFPKAGSAQHSATASQGHRCFRKMDLGPQAGGLGMCGDALGTLKPALPERTGACSPTRPDAPSITTCHQLTSWFSRNQTWGDSADPGQQPALSPFLEV